MPSYDVFAKFYDKAMGDRTASVNRVIGLIKKHNPGARTILELACGTGAVLKPLSKRYAVSGLDLSKGMLAIAKKNAPTARLTRQNMVGFKLPEKFDVILCLFDSINHLMKFSEWDNVFRNAYTHLNEEGLLIFDMNTREKLKALCAFRPSVTNLGRDLMILNVTSPDGKTTDWDITVFKHLGENKYIRRRDRAREISFPAAQVEKKLRKIYKKVRMEPAELKKFNNAPGRLYFCCQK